MELNKCPNCSGKLELAPNRKRLICSYCGSEFPLDEVTKQEIGGQPVNNDWFIYDWNYEKLMENPACKTVVSSFIRGLNEYEASGDLEKYIREYLMNFDEASAMGIREDKMKGIIQRFSGSFLPGEKSVALENSEWGHISVISIHSRSGSITGPPADRAYAVDPEGVLKSTPSALYLPTR